MTSQKFSDELKYRQSLTAILLSINMGIEDINSEDTHITWQTLANFILEVVREHNENQYKSVDMPSDMDTWSHRDYVIGHRNRIRLQCKDFI